MTVKILFGPFGLSIPMGIFDGDVCSAWWANQAFDKSQMSIKYTTDGRHDRVSYVRQARCIRISIPVPTQCLLKNCSDSAHQYRTTNCCKSLQSNEQCQGRINMKVDFKCCRAYIQSFLCFLDLCFSKSISSASSSSSSSSSLSSSSESISSDGTFPRK